MRQIIIPRGTMFNITFQDCWDEIRRFKNFQHLMMNVEIAFNIFWVNYGFHSLQKIEYTRVHRLILTLHKRTSR